MKTFPTNFATEVAKKTGITPVWILKLTVNAVDYYLSDDAYTVAGWNGGVTCLPWVAQWGRVRESAGGGLREVTIADVSVTCLIDPDASPNMETLATHSTLEKAAAELYLWFRGLNASTDPPQLMLKGYVKDPVEIPDQLHVSLTIEDEATRLLQRYIGTKIDLATYPGADPDDVGKILPLPYGAVRVPALGLKCGAATTLVSAITSGATSLSVVSASGIAANDVILIDSEKILVGSVSGNTLGSLTRGYSSTTAAAHGAGAPVFEVLSGSFVFAVSGRAVTSIDRVICRDGDLDVDVTDLCTRHTNGATIDSVSYSGLGLLAITAAQADSIRQRVADARVAVVNPTHDHGYNESRLQFGSNIPAVGSSNGTTATISPTYPAVGGSVIEMASDYEVSWAGGDATSVIKVNGVTISSGFSSGGPISWKGSTVGIPAATHQTSGSTSKTITLNAAQRTVVFSGTADATAQATAKAGTVNSVADSAIGGILLADVTAPTTTPLGVISDILSRAGISSCTQTGTLPASYAFAGVVLDYRRAADLLQELAWQCRCVLRVAAGAGKLLMRPDTLTSARTISACRIDGGTRVHARRKTPSDEVINKIQLLYQRDHLRSGDDAYQAVSATSDATSITDYGEAERPELFKCDWIASATMADSVRDFYLARYKRRRWLHEFDVMLDHSMVEFFDAVTLGFSGNAVGQVIEAQFAPGDSGRIDTVGLVVEV